LHFKLNEEIISLIITIIFCLDKIYVISNMSMHVWIFVILSSEDPKNGHLKELEGAKERLTLHKVDLLDLQSIQSVIHGCHGVFHTASPVTDNPVSNILTSLLPIYKKFHTKM
jgi:hypothetical protein